MVNRIQRLLVPGNWKDYAVLDCGDGLKREDWGGYVFIRPDPQVIWPKNPDTDWSQFDARYHRSSRGGGEWEFRRSLPASWTVAYEDLVFKVRPTNFKHTGLFPEQAVNWDWIRNVIGSAGRQISAINLFGYTGAATVAAAKAGARVCHVDAAKGMVQWCRENAALNGLSDGPVRYIVEDCLKFVHREIRRGRKYDAIMLDPPSFGRGKDGEIWKLENNLWELLVACRELLADRPLFFLLNAYTAYLSPTVLSNMVGDLFRGMGGTLTSGEIGLPVRSDGKVLPCGIFCRWENAEPDNDEPDDARAETVIH